MNWGGRSCAIRFYLLLLCLIQLTRTLSFLSATRNFKSSWYTDEVLFSVPTHISSVKGCIEGEPADTQCVSLLPESEANALIKRIQSGSFLDRQAFLRSFLEASLEEESEDDDCEYELEDEDEKILEMLEMKRKQGYTTWDEMNTILNYMLGSCYYTSSELLAPETSQQQPQIDDYTAPITDLHTLYAAIGIHADTTTTTNAHNSHDLSTMLPPIDASSPDPSPVPTGAFLDWADRVVDGRAAGGGTIEDVLYYRQELARQPPGTFTRYMAEYGEDDAADGIDEERVRSVCTFLGTLMGAVVNRIFEGDAIMAGAEVVTEIFFSGEKKQLRQGQVDNDDDDDDGEEGPFHMSQEIDYSRLPPLVVYPTIVEEKQPQTATATATAEGATPQGGEGSKVERLWVGEVVLTDFIRRARLLRFLHQGGGFPMRFEQGCVWDVLAEERPGGVTSKAQAGAGAGAEAKAETVEKVRGESSSSSTSSSTAGKGFGATKK